MTDLHRRVIIEATIEPLTQYRRGYARSKQGPFVQRRIIEKLVREGALRRTHRGQMPQVTARAS